MTETAIASDGGLTDPPDLDYLTLARDVSRKALEDPTFSDLLRSNPRLALGQMCGAPFPTDVKINLHDNTFHVVNLVIPLDPSALDTSDRSRAYSFERVDGHKPGVALNPDERDLGPQESVRCNTWVMPWDITHFRMQNTGTVALNVIWNVMYEPRGDVWLEPGQWKKDEGTWRGYKLWIKNLSQDPNALLHISVF